MSFIFPPGRSFQSSMLKINVAHAGACEEPCAGMEGMGQFQAFNRRATNSGGTEKSNESLIKLLVSGLCIHDFFRCASKMRTVGMGNSKV
jgi:hypothetical protein